MLRLLTVVAAAALAGCSANGDGGYASAPDISEASYSGMTASQVQFVVNESDDTNVPANTGTPDFSESTFSAVDFSGAVFSVNAVSTAQQSAPSTPPDKSESAFSE